MSGKSLISVFSLRRHRRLIAIVCVSVAGIAAGSPLFALPFGHMAWDGGGGHLTTGYIGPTVGLSPIDEAPAPWIGLRLGMEFDSAVAVGVVGNRLLTPVDQSDGETATIRYGGAEFRTFLLNGGPLSLTLDLVVGAGAAGSDVHFMGGGDHDSDEQRDTFLVVEPDIGFLVRVNRYARMELGFGYLFPSGVDLPGITDAKIGGPRASLSMSFGSWR